MEELDLDDLQGNILRGHRRSHVRAIFVEFVPGSDQEQRRRWLARIAERVTSAQDVETFAAKDAKPYWHAGASFTGVLLTFKGYEALGRADAAPRDAAFRSGFGERWAGSPVAPGERHGSWQHGGWAPADALVLLACGADPADSRLVDSLLSETLREMAGPVRVLRIDSGRVLLRQFEDGLKSVEPFGYVDGISGGKLVPFRAEAEARRGYDDRIEYGQVLLRDPAGGAGSFMVYQNLEQRLAEFREVTGQDEEKGAAIIGRRADGTPVLAHAPAGQAPGSGAASNDFSYEGLEERVPMEHIRAANPRTGPPPFARRGIPFVSGDTGRPYASYDPVQLARAKSQVRAGLLFMAYCRDLGEQFEPVLERMIEKGDRLLQFVIPHGGEYLFAPSKSGLRALAQPPPEQPAEA